ncbi:MULTISPECIES: hypothetical protein [unclassified Fusibacter]|uniref:hypothetical protein n=1 Tax=unclassified Fusibacter TaxID=2624464 RepID=UPI001013B296|nr:MULTISPECIES: hypothetical protein [unclassified Fusibacter]MCK8060338.1 hypothetical protein [Fusibacter sp. A2]NPE20373.1 hypothetical protein [Fusibacter sp. A1]RXV63579.1 hypothetical protein DWB64_00975 [Fusibacter sp. A1]
MKKLIAFGLIMASLFTVGCQKQSTDKDGVVTQATDTAKEITQETSKETAVTTSPEQPRFDIVGEVIQIDEGEIHVLTGDIAAVYKADQADIDKLYLGETVILVEKENGGYSAVPYLIEDFSRRFTSMGLAIESTQGVLVSVIEVDGHQTVEIQVKEEVISSDYFGETKLEVGKAYDIDLIRRGENVNIAELYDVSAYIKIEILAINKGDEGQMVLYGKSTDDGEYYVPTFEAVKNFNLSELMVGDEVEFYPVVIMESFPMQVVTNRINLK